MNVPSLLPTLRPTSYLSFPWEGGSTSPPPSRSPTSVSPWNIGTSAGSFRALGPRDFLPLSWSCKDAPAAKVERGSEAAGVGAPIGGGMRIPGRDDNASSHPPWYAGFLGPLRLLLGKTWCQLGGGMPRGGGTPSMESYPGRIPGTPPQRGIVHSVQGPCRGSQIPSQLRASVYPSPEWAH